MNAAKKEGNVLSFFLIQELGVLLIASLQEMLVQDLDGVLPKQKKKLM